MIEKRKVKVGVEGREIWEERKLQKERLDGNRKGSASLHQLIDPPINTRGVCKRCDTAFGVTISVHLVTCGFGELAAIMDCILEKAICSPRIDRCVSNFEKR